MAFWSSEVVEPKRKFRWKMIFNTLGGLSYALKKADKPKGKVNPTTHKYLNHSFNYPGRWEWEDINVTFASVSQPDATTLINKVLTNAGYGVPSTDGSVAADKNQLATLGKRKFQGALGEFITLVQFNPDGDEIEKWQIYSPFFTSVNYGDLDYTSEDIVDIQVGIKYDYAKLIPINITNEETTGTNPGFPNSGTPTGGSGGTP